MKAPFIIAIDGHSASGKGTLSQKLANKFNFAFLDTGKLYRFVAYNALNKKIDHSNVDKLLEQVDSLNFNEIPNESLHTPEVSDYASQIGMHAKLRTKMNEFQRNFPINHKGVVIDGRDIGTVIFPSADLKFFITASSEIRAERRFKQLQSTGKFVEYHDVLKDLKDRDTRDSNRSVAPSQAAPDAIVIDTSLLNAAEVLDLVYSLSKKHVDEHFKISVS